MNTLSTASPAPLSDYAVLRNILTAQGFFRRQRLYFVGKITLNIVLVVVAVVFLLFVSNLLLVTIAAAFFGFVWGQISLLLHDAGHRQMFKSPRMDAVIGTVCVFLLGGSFRWWVMKHNEHHAHPNHEDMDPDIDFPMLAFSEKQAREKRGLFRFIVGHQALLFFPMLCFTSLSLRANSIRFLVRQKLSDSWREILLLLAHIVLYFTLVFSLLTPFHGIVFILLHQAFFGLYMGLVFAPNHKGMPVIEKGEEIDFLRGQVLTSRNVRSHPLIDFCYGGLNYQIEHHLFPHMPRRYLRKARVIIKKFCEERAIPYHETGVIRSYVEILNHMHSVGLCCRMKMTTS